MCKHCKDFLEFFNKMFKPEKFWFFEDYPYRRTFRTKDFCRNNFLDNDNKVKSCLMFYAEKLAHYLDQPERSKGEDSIIGRIKDDVEKCRR